MSGLGDLLGSDEDLDYEDDPIEGENQEYSPVRPQRSPSKTPKQSKDQLKDEEKEKKRTRCHLRTGVHESHAVACFKTEDGPLGTQAG